MSSLLFAITRANPAPSCPTAADRVTIQALIKDIYMTTKMAPFRVWFRARTMAW